MTGSSSPTGFQRARLSTAASLRKIDQVLWSASPSLLFGLRLWASVSLALYVAFWLQLDNPFWAGASAAIVCQPQLGASLRKGWFRVIGTIVGAVMVVVLTACFPQDRMLFLGALALWAAGCAFVATLLRNFASYAAALSGYTTAIIAGDLFGTVGGVDANAAFMLAVTRATEISIGIICAGIVVAGTDFGGARRRLAEQLAELTGEIASGLAGSLANVTDDAGAATITQRGLVRRVIALNPVIDETLGESSEIRYSSAVLQRAVDGMLSALAAWYALSRHLATLSRSEAQHEALLVLEKIPIELPGATSRKSVEQWMTSPKTLHRLCRSAATELTAAPATGASWRVLADGAARALTGLADALDGVALLVDRSVGRPTFRRRRDSRLPDWMPALISAIRAFLAIVALALLWMITGWPGGGLAMTFAAIVTLRAAPWFDKVFAAALLFTVGAILDLVLTAIVAFAILPGLPDGAFVALCLVLGTILVPLGALLKHSQRPWQTGLFTAMTLGFVPILQPTNPEIYNPQLFYNVALPIIAGMGAGALSFSLVPPLSAGFRVQRLLGLVRRDLRRLAGGQARNDWERHVIRRLLEMPPEATSSERGQLLATLAVGREIMNLRRFADRFGFAAYLRPALVALANGNGASAKTSLFDLDEALAAADDGQRQEILQARGSVLVISEALTAHAVYFDSGARE